MATYLNDLRLTELATGEGSGTWGTTTNLSLELIGEALGFATQQVFGSDADATTTIADGASDPARAMYFKITSAGSLTATRTCTIAPNTISRVMFIENATTGSQSIQISQGSGASVTILAGKTAVVYLDGAGSGAAVVDAMAGVDPGVTDTLAEVLAAGNTSGANNLIIDNGQAITTNTINETTAASGVTIDSVLLKDDGVNATNLEITNLKANDGTSAGSIADSTGVVTLASSVLTTADINGGTIDGTVIGGTTAAAGSFTTGAFSGAVTANDGILIPNGEANPVNAYGATTGSSTFAIANTGGTSYFGNESSVAGTLATGTSAYGTAIGTSAARDINFFTSGATRLTIASTGAATFSGVTTIQGGNEVRLNRADNATYNEIKYVTSGDTFYFNQANGGAYSFNISGTPWLSVNNTGAATFGGAVTVTGDTIKIDSATHAFYTADRGDASSYAINRYYTAGTESWRVGLLNDGTSNFHIYDVAGSGDRLYIGTNGDISFYEDTGTTAKFFWDASEERLGIGTSSPTAPLTVNGGTASAATIQLGNHNDNASIHGKYSLSFKADSTEAIADRSISFAIGTAANFALTTSTAIFNDLGADIDFRVESDTNANMFVVDASTDRVGVGVAAPLETLHVAGSVFSSSGYYITVLQGNAQLTNASTSSGSNASYIGQGLITVVVSDAKAKENFGAVEENECLNKIVSLSDHVKKFDWIDEDWKREKGRTVGMVAQEVYEDHSEFVHKPENYNDDGWAIRYQEIVPTLIKAFQEQQELIKTLESRITALES
jgi:hypothetical protein